MGMDFKQFERHAERLYAERRFNTTKQYQNDQLLLCEFLEKNTDQEKMLNDVFSDILEAGKYQLIQGCYEYEKIKIKHRIREERKKEFSNSPEKREYQKRYRSNPEYKARRNQQIKDRAATDPLFKLSRSIRAIIYNAFRNKDLSKNEFVIDILGCSLDEFKKFIESKFVDGMNWDNRHQWHLDHIKPLATAKTEMDLIDLNHHTNFQPLWAIDNLRKGAKYE